MSCSTKKNTGVTRFWHSFTSRYNTYYNGTLAYIDASLEKEKGNKDNFTERLPLYTVSNKASRDLGKGNYDIAITKSKKIIQLHSIKAKPEWNKNRKKTPEDIEWLSRKEYNPFMWRAWMLMGRSQFYKGEFDEAAATFSYMSRLFKGQPSIYGKARAWLAKCYLENDWVYDAEDIIRNIERDSIHWKAQKEWDYTYASYYLRTNNLPKAVEYLQKVIKHEMRAKQRAREYYILGQIEAAQGHKAEACKAFRKVLKQNPPYELDFNARISMTEVMAEGQAKKMIGKLKRMARNDNNKEYLDQVYYAMGNIYLAEKDTAKAIAAYEKGNEKATRSGIEKGVLLLHLGDLYWNMEKYSDAKRCYGEAIGMLDKERKDYQQLSDRSKILDELVPYTDGIQLQDSLQALAKMDEKERNAAIDRVIAELKKKEKEEEAKAAEEELEKRQAKYANNRKPTTMPTPQTPQTIGRNNSAWYFYNPATVQQGKQNFQRLWGKRENADNWRRMNKTVVGDFAMDDNETSPLDSLNEEQRDSVMAAEKLQEEEQAKMDSAANDPHKREYYLAQIPFTEEAVAASNEIIKDGLLHSAIIFKDKLDNLALSEKQFNRLTTQFPEYEPKDEVYYHLFLLHSRKGDHDKAKTYIDSLTANCPDSKWTTVLTDPYFADNAKFGKHLEDSIYGATYEAFKADRFEEVYANNELSEKRFPLGENRDRFIFLDGMTRLNNGDADSCLSAMERIVKEYPQSHVAELAGMIINGVKQGRALHGAKFDLTNVWDRRNAVMNDADSTLTREFSADRNTDFMFLMAYPPDSINENQLLFQMARYNFTNFMVRHFDISIENAYGMHHMIVGGFRNYNEARQYAKVLLQQESIQKAMGKARPLVISNENLQLIGTRYSYNDYDSFYVANFAPLMVENPEQLYEPIIIKEDESKAEKDIDDDPLKAALPTEEVAPGGAKPVDPKAKEEEEENADNLIDAPADTEIAVPEDTEINVPEDTEIAVPAETEITVPADTEIAVPEETITVPEETITIPEETITVPEAVEEITIPAETEVTVPATEEEFTIPTETEAPATEEFAIPVQEEPTVAPTEEFAIPEPEEQNTSANDDVIVFEEDNTATADDEEELIIVDEKATTEDLEDEYYELDGF
ncbi:MAG: tetratricopeptide repeat protein [Prevotella sp.]|nr:tetratricopeptide repeat protein [Candidatus Prevotella equi]